MPRPFVVGLTGAIGSGKSEALRAFARLGAATLCLDEVARGVLRRGAPGFKSICQAFGRDILSQDGEIDRQALGRVVFRDPRARRRLERLTHPLILRQMRRRIRAHLGGLLVVDAPLLFEAGIQGEFDAILLVAAPRRTCLKRIVLRDSTSLAAARLRMAAQMPLSEKARRSDVVIYNYGSRQALRQKIREYYRAFELMHGG